LAKRVFISYRREDTAAVARLVYDRLWRVLGKSSVFFDVNAIGGGEDFEKRIITEISRSDAALILIGDKWLGVNASSERGRIWDSQDYVRAEVREALARSLLIIPLLVSGTRMPGAEQLPDDVKALSTKNAMSLRHESFEDDTENIIAAILGTQARERGWEKQASIWRRIAWTLGGMVMAAGTVLALALAHFAIFARPLEASIGIPSTVLLIVATIVLGGWAGLRQTAGSSFRK
jgi:hypothetical protein